MVDALLVKIKKSYGRKPQTKLIHKTLNPNTKLREVIKNLVSMVLEFVSMSTTSFIHFPATSALHSF